MLRILLAPALFLMAAAALSGCGTSAPEMQSGSTGVTVSVSDETSATTAVTVEADYVTVIHPYHSEYLDAPSYIRPRTITTSPGFSPPDLPEASAAQLLVSDELPLTDLELRSSEAVTGLYAWLSEEAFHGSSSGDVTLGSQDLAVEVAEGYLREHGLWSDEYGPPEVSVGSSQSGAEYTITSWRVRYPGAAVCPGIERYVSVRVGHENEVVDLALYIPSLEPLDGKLVRLRPLSEVLGDLDAWWAGESSDIQNEVQGEVDVVVEDVSLEWEDPGSGGEPVAVPVYVFRVEVRSLDGAPSVRGEWAVVAASDVEGSSLR